MGTNPLYKNRDDASSKEPQVEFYTDETGKYRWKLMTSGDELGAASQGYISKEECVEDLTKMAMHIVALASSGKLN